MKKILWKIFDFFYMLLENIYLIASIVNFLLDKKELSLIFIIGYFLKQINDVKKSIDKIEETNEDTMKKIIFKIDQNNEIVEKQLKADSTRRYVYGK